MTNCEIVMPKLWTSTLLLTLSRKHITKSDSEAQVKYAMKIRVARRSIKHFSKKEMVDELLKMKDVNDNYDVPF